MVHLATLPLLRDSSLSLSLSLVLFSSRPFARHIRQASVGRGRGVAGSFFEAAERTARKKEEEWSGRRDGGEKCETEESVERSKFLY